MIGCRHGNGGGWYWFKRPFKGEMQDAAWCRFCGTMKVKTPNGAGFTYRYPESEKAAMAREGA